MRGTRSLLALCTIALVAVALASGYWMIGTARAAMTREVIVGGKTVANERAAQLADAIGSAHDRLVAATALPGAIAAVERGDVEFLQAAMAKAMQNETLTRLAVTRGSDVLAKSPHDVAAIVVEGDRPQLRPSGGHDASLSFSAPISNAEGVEVARLHQELSLQRLVPRFTRTSSHRRDVATLVTTNGRVLLSAEEQPVSQVTTPKLLELVSRQASGGVRYHSQELDADRIASTAPVPGYPWVVIVDAAASTANAPAGSLVARLLGQFALMLVVMALILTAAGLLIVSGRRQLQRAHQRTLLDATTDPLTGVFNRRAFDRRLAALRDSDATVAVVMVDIDELKGLNDTFGHDLGDQAIRRIADAVSASIRSTDEVFRIGGDEFVVLTSELGEHEIAPLVERIAATIAGGVMVGDRRVRATVGAASGPGTLIDETLRRADAEMYRNKRSVTTALR